MDKNKDKKISSEELGGMTNKILYPFCRSLAQVGKECFEKVTEKGVYQDLFSVLDSNSDK